MNDMQHASHETNDTQGGTQGRVYLVGGGPGDPGLLTLRGAEVLASADVVLHDELIHPALLDFANPDADVRSVGKRGSDRVSKQAKQTAIENELVALARAGKCVVRLKGGDPFLFGRGSEEAEALALARIPFEVVPGVCSPLGATAYAGFSLTHRDMASSVVFVSGTTRAGKLYDFGQLACIEGTICVLMAMHNMQDVVQGLLGPAKRDPKTPAAVIQWGTRAEQRVVAGKLDEIVDKSRAANLGSPGIVIVGTAATVRPALRWFDTRPLFGKRVLVLRPRAQAHSVAKWIRRRGGEALLWPAIEIVPPADPGPLERLCDCIGDYHVVALTSENGVGKLFEMLEGRGRDARAFGQARVAAIGTGTAAALGAHGIRADIVPHEFHGEGLADAILADPFVRNRLSQHLPLRVVVPRARVARDALPERLRKGGCEVTVVTAYETKKAGPDEQAALVERLANKEIDVILLSASSTADALADALGNRASELLEGVCVASIGDITAQTAMKRGIAVSVTATVSTMEGLVAAVERWFE